MQKKVLTVAIAAYNMENYLSKCINSLLVEVIMDDIEILIINDGSQDSSLAIAQKYQSEYQEVIRVIDKTNGGYGSAINKAIDTASGKYFKILDADDWFDGNMLVPFIQNLKNTDSDLIISHFSYEDIKEKESKPIYFRGIQYYKPYDFQEFCIAEKTNEIEFSMHAMTYKTDILLKDNFRLSEGYYSDTDFTAYPLVNVNSIVFFDLILYKYVFGREGQSVSGRSFAAHFEDHNLITKKLLDYYHKYYSHKNTAISLNIGYKAIRVMCTNINIMYGALYEYNKDAAIKAITDFKKYIQTFDSELKGIAIKSITFMESKRNLPKDISL